MKEEYMEMGFQIGKGRISFSLLEDVKENVSFSEQLLNQDLFQVQFEDCIIDVGQYTDTALTILVIIKDGTKWDWENPYVIIPCYDITDFKLQLQRAIDLYGPFSYDKFGRVLKGK